jgi:hypothetical protein
MKKLLLSLLFVATTASAKIFAPPPLPNFTKLLAAANTMIVWQGLPSRSGNWNRYAEAKQTPHHLIAGELFYLKPVTVSAKHHADLNRLVRANDVFKPYGGYKFCGGFHADYAIEWKRDDERLAVVLICLTCHETLIVLPKEQVQTDLTNEGYNALRDLLRTYRDPLLLAVADKKNAIKPEIIPVPPPTLDLKPAPEPVRAP